MDEQSEAMFIKYEAWKVERNVVDGLMEEARAGFGDPDALVTAIEKIRNAWSEFERVSASRLHHRHAPKSKR